MKQTHVDRALQSLEEQHASDPERAEALRITRRFKASWLELGEALSRIKQEGAWERWGHASFEAYTKNELKLRSDTVEKLTAGFMFLRNRAPEVLSRDPLEAMPSYQAIDYLRRVEERAQEDDSISADDVSNVRRQILEENAPVAKVARLYNDSFFPMTDHDRKESNRKAIVASCTRLLELLGQADIVPNRVSSQARQAVEALVAALDAKENAA